VGVLMEWPGRAPAAPTMKAGQGANDEEHAMSRTVQAAIAVWDTRSPRSGSMRSRDRYVYVFQDAQDERNDAGNSRQRYPLTGKFLAPGRLDVRTAALVLCGRSVKFLYQFSKVLYGEAVFRELIGEGVAHPMRN
jgi:hypothetical protein